MIYNLQIFIARNFHRQDGSPDLSAPKSAVSIKSQSHPLQVHIVGIIRHCINKIPVYLLSHYLICRKSIVDFIRISEYVIFRVTTVAFPCTFDYSFFYTNYVEICKSRGFCCFVMIPWLPVSRLQSFLLSITFQ